MPTSSASRRGPGAGRVDHHRALDRPLGGLDPADPPPLVEEPGHRGPRREGHAHLPGRRRELAGHERRVEVAVLRREQDRPGAGCAEVRRPPLGLVRRQELDLDPEGLGQRPVAAHLSLPLRGEQDAHRADAVEADRAAGHALEGRQRLHRLVHELHHELGPGHLGREPGRPRGGLRPEVVAVEEDDVAHAALGQMIGGAGAESARSDDDDLGSIPHAGASRSPRYRFRSDQPRSAVSSCMLETRVASLSNRSHADVACRCNMKMSRYLRREKVIPRQDEGTLALALAAREGRAPGVGPRGRRRCRARAASAGSGDAGRVAARGAAARGARPRAEACRTKPGPAGGLSARTRSAASATNRPSRHSAELDATPGIASGRRARGGSCSQRGPRRTVLSRATVRV